MKKLLLIAAITAGMLPASSALAHVSIIPGVAANGSTIDSLKAGQRGFVNFRIGHGCSLEKETINPATKTSMLGSNWGTKEFSVEIPVVAQGTGTTIPRPAWVPGWKTTVKKDTVSGNYVVTWKSTSRTFDVPDAPEGGAGGKLQFDFGVRIQWAADAAGQKVYFKSVQTCQVDVPGVKAKAKTKTKPAVKAIKPRSFDIKVSWEKTDGTGADTVADLIEHNDAPSVTVLAAS
jgi:uncharacterized protein YcnI